MLRIKYHAFLVFIVFGVTSCFMAVRETPNVAIESLGTILEPGDSYAWVTEFGPVEICYLGPTSRGMKVDGNGFVLDLKKSSGLNGIYTDGQRVSNLGEGLKGVIYEESTSLTADSPMEVRKMFEERQGYSDAPGYGILFKIERSHKFPNYLYIGILDVQKEEG